MRNFTSLKLVVFICLLKFGTCIGQEDRDYPLRRIPTQPHLSDMENQLPKETLKNVDPNNNTSVGSVFSYLGMAADAAKFAMFVYGNAHYTARPFKTTTAILLENKERLDEAVLHGDLTKAQHAYHVYMQPEGKIKRKHYEFQDALKNGNKNPLGLSFEDEGLREVMSSAMEMQRCIEPNPGVLSHVKSCAETHRDFIIKKCSSNPERGWCFPFTMEREQQKVDRFKISLSK